MTYRLLLVLFFCLSSIQSPAQFQIETVEQPNATERSQTAEPELALSDLPESPTPQSSSLPRNFVYPSPSIAAPELNLLSSKAPLPAFSEVERFHWNGLIVQSISFDLLQNATRIITADQHDRHYLLNKPYWSDYWASLQQFNMRRWNDGDSFPVNYVGHPMEGAIAGYIEIQNDPRGRNLIIGKDGRQYWNSRFRAFLWATVYSTQWEIGPLGETAIFNQGGFTYPIRCEKHVPATVPGSCESPNATYTNNTGWVDFIITPTIGTLWLIGEDTLDRYVSDPLVHHHPNAFGYKLVRASLNPSRSLANILRGHFPWFRDVESPDVHKSPINAEFLRALDSEHAESADLNLFYSSLSLETNHPGCTHCRTTTTGAGAELGIRILRGVDFVTIIRSQPSISPISSLNVGGSLLAANFGLRAGYSGRYIALKLSLAPGFASYSNTNSGRNFNFSTLGDLSGDVRVNPHFAFRATLEQMLIRYKSLDRDPPGIGTPPRLSFLSHDNYINSTNWGFRIGPVIRF